MATSGELAFHKEFTVAASSARTATLTGSDQTNDGWTGVVLTLDITVWNATSLDVKVQMKDQTSGKYVDIPGAAFAQKSGTGTDTLVIYPGIGETANRSVSDVLPATWRIVGTQVGTSATYSVGACYMR